MKHKLNDAMDHISDAFIADAAAQINKARGAAVPPNPRPRPWLGAVAAVLVLALIGALLFPVFNALDSNGSTDPTVLQSPTTNGPTIGTTRPSIKPTTSPTTIPATTPTIPGTILPTSGPTGTSSSTTKPSTAPSSITRPTAGTPCANGHTYCNKGFCIFCLAVDPDYDPCKDGHNFQNYYCIDCGLRHPCADGHSYENGLCQQCLTPDPAVAVQATITMDKVMYTTNESIYLTISPSGTTYRLNIGRYAFSFADEPWEQHYKDVGTSFTLSFEQPGRYWVSVAPNSSMDTIWQSLLTTLAIVDPCTSSSGHTFDRGFCTICGAKDYLYDFCGVGGCTSYDRGYCKGCGSIYPACATGHSYSVRNGHCIRCNAPHPACDNGHSYKDGFCINCGVLDPNIDPCANGHTFQKGSCIYCDTVDPCAKGHTFEDGCCSVCGIPIACYHGMHSYENGFCKYCRNQELFDEDARLIVNGKDITAGNYVKINMQDSNRYSNASIPLTAVLTELGIPWEWESDTVLRFGSSDSMQTIDLTLNAYNFPIPPGATGAVRKVVGDEVIVDLYSLWANLLSNQGIPFEIDCATKTIRIGTA